MVSDATTGRIDDVEEFGTDPRGVRDRWVAEILHAEKERKNWVYKVDKILKTYKDEDSKLRFNVLWSNINTLQPGTYSQTPIPVVDRRIRDGRDAIGRDASLVLTDSLKFLLSSQDFDAVMYRCRDDFLLAGFGQAWIRYEGEVYEDVADGRDYHEVGHENVLVDHVYFKDFLHSTARSWDEVRWVAKRIYLTRDDLIYHFESDIDKEKLKAIPLDYKPEDIEQDEDATFKDLFSRATVYEIWDKDSKKVYYVCKGYMDGCLREEEDPLGLTNFFPCPRPLLSTTTGESLIPIPDYSFYKKQAELINDLSIRIERIADAIKPNGVYDSTFNKLGRILDADLKMIPVDNWSDFVAKNGFQGVMAFLPLKPFADTLEILYKVRDSALQSIYEIIGLSDIIRGSTHPRETAVAQQMKGQFASLRLDYKQKEMQRFCKDIINLMGEVVAEQFEEQSLYLMSGWELKENIGAVNFSDVVALLREDVLRQFRIEVETNSTIAANEQYEREARTDFLNSVGQFFQQGMAFAQASPAFTPLMGKLLMFGIKSFKSGRVLEDDLNFALEKYAEEQMQRSQQEPPPDPKVLDIEAKKMIAQMQMQMEQYKIDTEAQIEQLKLQTKMQIAAMGAQREDAKTQNEIMSFWEKARADVAEVQQRSLADSQKAQAEIQKLFAELQVHQQKVQADLELKALDLQEKREQKEMQAMAAMQNPPAQPSGPINIVLDKQSPAYTLRTMPDGSRRAEPDPVGQEAALEQAVVEAVIGESLNE